MNPILQVKLRLDSENNHSRPAGRTLSANATTSIDLIEKLVNDLHKILIYYQKSDHYINGLLVDACYNNIIAKSKRIQDLLKPMNGSTNSVIVGARFSNAPEGMENHIITYYVDENVIKKSIKELEICGKFLREKLDGKATKENFNNIKDKSVYEGYSLSMSKIRSIIVDCSVLESFNVPDTSYELNQDNENVLVTLFKTELSLSELMYKLHIDEIRYSYTTYGDNTISVQKDLYEILCEKVPYMISMISTDISKVRIEDVTEKEKLAEVKIDSPMNEPTIGVIDTLFDENVYFSEWVENHDVLNEVEKELTKNDLREHGTEVSSIIVDGPRMNPLLDDGCGRFKVRHFGVCGDRISTVRLVKKIKDIVDRNPDIHVWNLSMGTDEEISKNFVSFDGAFLDELQAKKNIVFVVSGTNDNRKNKKGLLKVGSPADSLNSIVVNSVRRNGNPASYSRMGKVLSFFNKPDISYYGGDFDERIKAYSPVSGESYVYGTSFAAPWISRKLCYLIDVMGIPREIAKAMIIDSAAGWDYKKSTYKKKDIIGYGVVPIDIHKVMSSDDDEIKFYVYGSSESYKTSNYRIPVPKDSENKYPYLGRATLCYFPECSRSQGIDYTNRELSLSFGRIKNDGSIDDINDNIQDEECSYIDERQSRIEFRKWENTKFISRVIKEKCRPLKSYEDRLWGLSVVSKERLSTHRNGSLNFGVVITLKEINGVNRIDDFIKLCSLKGWIVNCIDVQNRLEIYNTNQEQIEFD